MKTNLSALVPLIPLGALMFVESGTHAQEKPKPTAPPSAQAADEFRELLERLRSENPGEYEKVRRLAEQDRAAAWRFLRQRYESGNAAKAARSI